MEENSRGRGSGVRGGEETGVDEKGGCEEDRGKKEGDCEERLGKV